MALKDRVDLELRPREVDSFGFVGYRPPESASEDALDEVGVVAWADEGAIGRIGLRRLHVESIRVVDLPQEVEVSE